MKFSIFFIGGSYNGPRLGRAQSYDPLNARQVKEYASPKTIEELAQWLTIPNLVAGDIFHEHDLAVVVMEAG